MKGIVAVASAVAVVSLCLTAPESLSYNWKLRALNPSPSVKPAAAQPQPVREKWALLVGVGEFQDPSLAALPAAASSTAALAAALRDPQSGRFAADHVKVLTGKQATRVSIEDALVGSWLAKKALPNDLVVVYFNSRLLPDADGKGPLLCTYDTLVSDGGSAGVALQEALTDLRRRLQSRRIVVILDTSPAGQALPEAATAAELAKVSGVAILSSGAPGKPAPQPAGGGRTVLVDALIEGVKTAGGLLPMSSLASHAAQQLAAAARTPGSPTLEAVLAVPPDNEEIAEIPLGVMVKSSQPPRKVAIGHPVDRLPITRPDLARKSAAAPSTADEGDDDDDDEVSGDVDFGAYMSKMKADIQKQWQPPRGFEDRRVVTVFTILRDGTITNASVVKSSGIDKVDQSAMAALKAASPLDPLPLGAPRYVNIRYQFDWRVKRN